MSAYVRGKPEIFLLGKLLLSQKPEVAKELLTDYENKNASPTETDISKLDGFFHTFCLIRDINSNDYTSFYRKTRKADEQRYFVACMLHLYCPELYTGYKARLYQSYGFVTNMARTIKKDRANITRMIQEVVMMERVYTDFKENVHGILSSITGNETD